MNARSPAQSSEGVCVRAGSSGLLNIQQDCSTSKRATLHASECVSVYAPNRSRNHTPRSGPPPIPEWFDLRTEDGGGREDGGQRNTGEY